MTINTRKVQFTFSREQDENQLFEPDVHAAMREYMAKQEAYIETFGEDAPGTDYTASNGVRIQINATSLALGDVGHLPPHQQRVLSEQAELHDRLKKLAAFLETDRFKSLDPAEQDRMHAQLNAMDRYFGVLAARIAVFGGSN
jgi:hypothetical protein